MAIDLESKDAKLKRRQIRNRLSAQYHRDRKNAHIKELEDDISAKANLIQTLYLEIENLKTENSQLILTIQALRGENFSSNDLTDNESKPSDSPIMGSHDMDQTYPSNGHSYSSGLLSSPFLKTFMLFSTIFCLSYQVFTVSNDSLLINSQRRQLSEISTDLSYLPYIPNHAEEEELQVHHYLRKPLDDKPKNTVSYSKDLVPYQYTDLSNYDIFSNQNKINSHSHSKIFLKKGLTLFHPSFKLDRQNPSLNLFEMPKRIEKNPIVVPIVTLKPNLEENSIPKDNENKNWPALPSTLMMLNPPLEEQKPDNSDPINSIPPKYHSVSITIPTNSIRIGNNPSDSNEARLEQIWSMLDLHNSSSPSINSSSILLRLDCIVLDAEVISGISK